MPGPVLSLSRSTALSLALAVAALVAMVATAGAQTRSDSPDPVPAGGSIVARDVTVRAGESLVDIARRELGLAGYAGPLADFNELDPDAALSEGQLIRIPIHVPARGEVALIVFLKGESRRNGAVLELESEVVEGDVLETGPDGFVSIEFSTGSVINLQPESRVVLEKLACLENDDSCLIEIDAERGAIAAEVQRRKSQPAEFRITTPFSSAAVRGTEFDFQVEQSSMRVAVTEGEVDTRALGETLALQSGFGSVTLEGEPPGQPVALLPAPVFRNVPARLATGDLVRWWALSDASKYLLSVSNDSEGAETVREIGAGGDSDAANMNEVPPGDYFLNLRAVDSNQLPGFRASTRLVVAGIDPDLAAPSVTIERENTELLVRVETPDAAAAGYEIQISRDADFADPLGVDVGPTGQAVFRIDADTIHARARALATPQSVSAFGRAAVLR